MAKKKIQEMVEDYFRESSEEWIPDYELYDVEFLKEGSDYYLRVYIDRRDGEYIGTDDCERVSRGLSQWLDTADPIEQNYFLEVSSPGLDRSLKKAEHFMRYMGKEIEVSLYKPIDKEKKLTGILSDYREGDITITLSEGRKIEIGAKDIAKVNLAFSWGEIE